jgi:hypothetical protein
MSKSNGNGNGATRAVLYLRQSTKDKQEASIPTQRESLLKYAARKGYVVVREYADKVSGDASKRPDFDRMVRDAVERRISTASSAGTGTDSPAATPSTKGRSSSRSAAPASSLRRSNKAGSTGGRGTGGSETPSTPR